MGPRITPASAPATQEITPITGGSQSSTSTTQADVTGSDMVMAVGWYDFSFSVLYNAAVTSTGIYLGVNGNSGLLADPINVTVLAYPLAGDTPAQAQFAFVQGFTFTSSRSTTNNRAIVSGNMKVTTAGTLVLRFASEVGGSAITITGLKGWWRPR